MANLFLDGLFELSDSSPSSVGIVLPSDNESSAIIKGLMVGEPTFSAQNSWGTIINDLSNLQDFASLAGNSNQFSWVGASTMCWKGTKPLGVNFEFYLINYKKKGLLFESKGRGGAGLLQRLISLASLSKADDATLGSTKVRVKVHGGYAPDILTENASFFGVGETSKGGFLGTGLWLSDQEKRTRADRARLESSLQSFRTSMSEDSLLTSQGESAFGSCDVHFGKKLRIRNLLLSKIDVTPSVVEVADQNGGSRRPLYYRVSVGFTGVRALLSTDVKYMWWDN